MIALLYDAVIVSDLSFTVIDWNAAAARLYGWAIDEVQGRLVQEVIPIVRYLVGGDQQQAIAALQRNGFWCGEVIQGHRDGRELVISSSVQVLRDTNGQSQAYIAINRDVSSQRMAERALEHYTARLNILHHMNQRSLAGASLDNIIAEVLDQLRRLVPVSYASVL
ncbi:MAG: PAS domain S-box protein, partial [Oscillochloris sp.]|nr:PAS domain S-box protein [Oscillochloris sp.]